MKLTEEQKREIIQLHNDPFTREELASRFKISYAYVCKLIRDSKALATERVQ